MWHNSSTLVLTNEIIISKILQLDWLSNSRNLEIVFKILWNIESKYLNFKNILISRHFLLPTWQYCGQDAHTCVCMSLQRGNLQLSRLQFYNFEYAKQNMDIVKWSEFGCFLNLLCREHINVLISFL